MKDGPKECVDCRAESCDPCPAMMGEDGAVLRLLERLAQRHPILGGTSYPVIYQQYKGQWRAEVYNFGISGRLKIDPLVRAEAATLYQALLLAAEALDENDAAINDLGRERGDIRDDWP